MNKSKMALAAALSTFITIGTGIVNALRALSDEVVNSAVTEEISAQLLRDYLMILYVVLIIIQLIVFATSLLAYFKSSPGLMIAALIFSLSGYILGGVFATANIVLIVIAIVDLRKLKAKKQEASFV